MKKSLFLFFIIFSLLLSFPFPMKSKTCSYPGGNITVGTDDLCLELDYPVFGNFDLNIDQNLNQLIAWFYYFIVGISGFAAFLTLVRGGFQWLTSTGNTGKISEAKDLLNSAILGLVIILASFLILKVINPELTTLNLPGLP